MGRAGGGHPAACPPHPTPQPPGPRQSQAGSRGLCSSLGASTRGREQTKQGGGGQLTGAPPECLQEAGLPRSLDLSRERDTALSGAAPSPPLPPSPPPLTPDTPGAGGDSGGSSGGARGALMACGGKAAPVRGGQGGPQRSPRSPSGVPNGAPKGVPTDPQ